MQLSPTTRCGGGCGGVHVCSTGVAAILVWHRDTLVRELRLAIAHADAGAKRTQPPPPPDIISWLLAVRRADISIGSVGAHLSKIVVVVRSGLGKKFAVGDISFE